MSEFSNVLMNFQFLKEKNVNINFERSKILQNQ